MTTKEFLRILNREIEVLPAPEVQRAIIYYRELIEDRMEEGMSENEAVGSMEDISLIAQQILAEHEDILKDTHDETKQHNRKESWQHFDGGWRKAVIIGTSPLWLSVLAALLCFVFSIYILIWCIIFALYALVALFGILGFAGMIAFFFDISSHTPLAIVELGIALFSIGAFMISYQSIRNVQNQLFAVQKAWLHKVKEAWEKRRFW